MPAENTAQSRINDFLQYLTRKNTLTALIVIYAIAGFYVVATTDLSAMGLINTLDEQALAFGIGVGLAQIKFSKALPGEPLLGYFALVVIGVAVVGAYNVFETKLTYEAYMASMTPYVAALSIAKGLFANNSRS
jgi:hypothetical protein